MASQRFRDFGSQNIFDASTLEPVIFRLDGQTFTCRPVLPGAALLEFVSGADSGEGGRASESVLRFFKAAMDPTEYERFSLFINRSDRVVPIEVLADISAWLVEVYSERPTPLPSASPDGTSATETTSVAPASSEASTTSV